MTKVIKIIVRWSKISRSVERDVYYLWPCPLQGIWILIFKICEWQLEMNM